MKNTIRKLLSILLVLAMAMGLLPGIRGAAHAAGSVKAIQLVANGAAGEIEGKQASYIYFGKYKQNLKYGYTDTYNEGPVKWRVLKNGDGTLFLLADQNLDVMWYHVYSGAEVTWKTSTIRSWLNAYADSENIGGMDYSNDSFIGTAFTVKEQAAIAVTALNNPPTPDYNEPVEQNTNDKVFLLSAEEVQDAACGFLSDKKSSDTRIATNTAYVAAGGKLGRGDMSAANQAENWWLRSPGITPTGAKKRVDKTGAINSPLLDFSPCAVRPAFHIDLDKVLFISAVPVGKIGEVGVLAQVDEYSGSDWKLTILDSERSGFTASYAGASGKQVNVKYSGAKTGKNEYISAMIVDSSGAVAYYGRLAEASSESGSVTIDTDGKLKSGDTLYVFNEQFSGTYISTINYASDYATDYASELKAISFNVLPVAPTITTTFLPSGTVGVSYSQNLAADGDTPIAWTITGELPAGLKLSENTISGAPTAAETKTFTVKAENATGSDTKSLSITIDAAPRILNGISVTTPPAKTTYMVGERFDAAGMVVTASYSDGSTAVVTGYTLTPSGALTADDTSVEISYTEDGIARTVTQAITVEAPATSYLIGDANNDGKVNAQDRVILSRYLAKWPGYENQIVSKASMDINNDGKVNAQDRVILSRYLAKWGGEYDTYFEK